MFQNDSNDFVYNFTFEPRTEEEKQKDNFTFMSNYFNFDDFNDSEYYEYLSLFNNVVETEKYSIYNFFSTNSDYLFSLSDGECYVVVFLKNNSVSHISYCCNVLQYIGSRTHYGDSFYIRKVPLKYTKDLIFELKFNNGLLLGVYKKFSFRDPALSCMKYNFLSSAKKAYKLKYGMSSKSKLWKDVNIFAYINVGNKYKAVISKPDLDRYIKNYKPNN